MQSPSTRLLFSFALVLGGLSGSGIALPLAQAETLVVPASTAYLEQATEPAGRPVTQRTRVQVRERGVIGFGKSDLALAWYGQFKTTGMLTAKITLLQPAAESGELNLTLGKQMAAAKWEANDTEIAFPGLNIRDAGYHALRLTADSENRIDIANLTLQGPAVADCHFNLKPRKNAASVHLRYPVPAQSEVQAFYCEMTGVDDPIWTYYMACGWHRGYFGMQVNSASERRIIFSVWDSGGEAVDRDKVGGENRVRLIEKGEDVYAGDFGNEGTGGHSHLKFKWKTGEKQRFVVTAKPVDATHTIYSGYYFRPDQGKWMLISSWNAPHEGGYLRRLYSFSENFAGNNGQVRRKSLYGNQWIRDSAGNWTELVESVFSHDATGHKDRLDRFMGVENGQFFLSHGGFVDGFTKSGRSYLRAATNKRPELDLPKSAVAASSK